MGYRLTDNRAVSVDALRRAPTVGCNRSYSANNVANGTLLDCDDEPVGRQSPYLRHDFKRGQSMIERRKVLFGDVALALGACGLVKSYAPFRDRLTVKVDTPQDLRTGSSVIKVAAGEIGTTLGGADIQVRGKADAVELPSGQTLFALLREDSDIYPFAEPIMFDGSPRPSAEEGYARKEWGPALEAVRAKRRVNVVQRTRRGYFQVNPPSSAYAMLVRIGDITEPISMEQVDPDNLAASLEAPSTPNDNENVERIAA